MPDEQPQDKAPQPEPPKPEDPQKDDPKPEEKKDEKPAKPKKRMGPVGWIVLLVVLVVAAVGGVILWNYLGSYEATDDAQIDGDIYAITSRIAGTVRAVHVQDNENVHAGQLLVELDQSDYDVAVSQARAALGESKAQIKEVQPNVPLTSTQTESTVSTSESDISMVRAQIAAAQRDQQAAVAQVRQAEADNAKAQADLVRYQQLIAKDEISQQQFDQAQANARAAAARVDAQRANAEAAARTVDFQQARLQQAATRANEAKRARPQQIAIQQAMVQTRRASAERQQTVLDQALLNLSYTKIVAPVDGVIGRKNAEPGQQVSPGQQLMADVPLQNVWVTANFKENQLRNMRADQRVTIHVDAFDQDFEGYVESVAGASGARFSLLPPENATGNYVKVVQRVPVRIRLKAGQDDQHRLRPGMSVTPKVWIK